MERESTKVEPLTGRLKARAPDAWASIYDECYPLLFRYALVRTSDASAAEDLAATVFLEAVRGIDSYRDRGKPLLAWLYGIARNLVSDHLKSARRKDAHPLSAVPEPALAAAVTAPHHGPPDSPDPANDAELLDLRAAVRRLKDTQREVLILHYYVGLSLPEVALTLRKKERAVYSLHARALESLRKCI